jgi:hypothetical protein
MPGTLSAIIGDGIASGAAKVGIWDGDGTYSNILDIYGVVTVTGALRLVNARREGDSKLLALYSKVVGGTLSMEIANNQLSRFAQFLNQTYETSGSTPNQVGRLRIFNKTTGYIGLTFGLDDDEGLENAFHVFAPKGKITSDSLDIFAATGNESPEFGTTTIEFELLPDANFRTGAASEVQSVDITGVPDGGTFTLSFGSETTTALAFNADAAAIDAALELLETIGTGNVVVTGTNPTFTVTFGGTLANAKLPLLVSDGALLTGGTAPDVDVTRDTAGSEGDDAIIDLWEDEQGTMPLLPPALSV